MRQFNGGVCSAKGFWAAGAACGIKEGSDKKDMALIVSEVPCSAAAVYTQNKVKGAPIIVTQENISDGKAQAIICNSGNANTCAPNGIELAKKTCEIVAKAADISPKDVIVASTGVIGQEMSIEPFENGIPKMAKVLTRDGGQSVAEAMMTTDTVPKTGGVQFEIGGVVCNIGGAAKGSGMINPNMATMLCFMTTDAAITPEMLQKALSETVKTSFNQICVDGDTSTNDTVAVMASGMAGSPLIDKEGEDFDTFCEALQMLSVHFAKSLAADGEGATKLIECNVKGAPDVETARKISKSVIASDLLKAAIFGSDANWGRVLCAIGYAEGDFSVENVDVTMSSKAGSVFVCEGSMHKEFDENLATGILSQKEITIDVDLHQGDAEGTAWGCDLTYDYVKINGDYRS